MMLHAYLQRHATQDLGSTEVAARDSSAQTLKKLGDLELKLLPSLHEGKSPQFPCGGVSKPAGRLVPWRVPTIPCRLYLGQSY